MEISSNKGGKVSLFSDKQPLIVSVTGAGGTKVTCAVWQDGIKVADLHSIVMNGAASVNISTVLIPDYLPLPSTEIKTHKLSKWSVVINDDDGSISEWGYLLPGAFSRSQILGGTTLQNDYVNQESALSPFDFKDIIQVTANEPHPLYIIANLTNEDTILTEDINVLIRFVVQGVNASNELSTYEDNLQTETYNINYTISPTVFQDKYVLLEIPCQYGQLFNSSLAVHQYSVSTAINTNFSSLKQSFQIEHELKSWDDTLVLYQNHLGVYETFRCTGKNNKNRARTSETGIISNRLAVAANRHSAFNYNTRTNDKIQVNTGYLEGIKETQLAYLLKSNSFWIYENDEWTPVRLTTSEAKLNEDDLQLNSVELEFIKEYE